ncbi:hypothetical protein V6N11_003398 [Hibiscus sabdariffa]|uniref:Uncharacterized protein n=2 Tax=Hibiscus sabdariffa TaxID=183260 RepID=A0ABR1ZGJ5_9ROSI
MGLDTLSEFRHEVVRNWTKNSTHLRKENSGTNQQAAGSGQQVVEIAKLPPEEIKGGKWPLTTVDCAIGASSVWQAQVSVEQLSFHAPFFTFDGHGMGAGPGLRDKISFNCIAPKQKHGHGIGCCHFQSDMTWAQLNYCNRKEKPDDMIPMRFHYAVLA